MSFTFKWETRFMEVSMPVPDSTPSELVKLAEDARAELDKALQDFDVREPVVGRTYHGLKLTFTFRFDPDFLRFDPVKKQNELVTHPRKRLLAQRLKDAGATESRH
jgi:hypothetical protein